VSIPLIGTGGLFTRLGVQIGAANHVTSAYQSQLDTDILAIFNQFLASDQGAISNLYPARDAARSSYQSFPQAIQAIAQNTVVAQVNDDAPLATATYQNALAVLIAQMRAAGSTLQRPTTSATVTAGSGNAGNGVVVASLTGPDGTPLDMVFGEVITFTVTADAGNGNATKFQEPLSAAGQPSVPAFNYNWPGGSAASASLKFVDAASTSTTLVTDGGFAQWSGTGNNTPTKWAVGPGTAGTQVLQGLSSQSPPRAGTSFLRFVSDGSTLTAVSQALTGLTPLTVYAVNLLARTSVLDSGASFAVSLTDGTSVINNAASVAQTYSRNFNGQVTTAWTEVSVFFQTPALLPATPTLQIALTGAGTAGHFFDFDLVSLYPAVQLYSGGPFAAAFAGSAQAVKGDTYSLAVTNSGGTQSFVRAMDRYFNLRTSGLAFPSTASSPTVSDSLITH